MLYIDVKQKSVTQMRCTVKYIDVKQRSVTQMRCTLIYIDIMMTNKAYVDNPKYSSLICKKESPVIQRNLRTLHKSASKQLAKEPSPDT